MVETELKRGAVAVRVALSGARPGSVAARLVAVSVVFPHIGLYGSPSAVGFCRYEGEEPVLPSQAALGVLVHALGLTKF